MYSHLSAPKAEACLPRKPNDLPCLAMCLVNPNALTHTVLPSWRPVVCLEGGHGLPGSQRVAESRPPCVTLSPPDYVSSTLKTHYTHQKAPQADALMTALIFSLNLFVVILCTTLFFCQHWPLAEITPLLPVSRPDVFTDSYHGHPQPLHC